MAPSFLRAVCRRRALRQFRFVLQESACYFWGLESCHKARAAKKFQMTWISSSEAWPSLIAKARTGFFASGRGQMMKYATSG
jgi:hypothetical protein